jgi:hypothetical protein
MLAVFWPAPLAFALSLTEEIGAPNTGLIIIPFLRVTATRCAEAEDGSIPKTAANVMTFAATRIV